MTESVNPELDLTLTRIIKAPRSIVWRAWTDPASFEQWWVPAPARCQVVAMEVRPGGALETRYSEDGGEFVPLQNACFLDVVEGERIVFSDALHGGWRPAEHPFMTAIITMREHPEGTEYHAHVKHRNHADRARHEEMGFFEGWGAVTEQLANLAEQQARADATVS